MGFRSLDEIMSQAKKNGIRFWEVILEEDCKERQVAKEDSMNKMLSLYHSMKEANDSYDSKLRSSSKLAGGDGEKLMNQIGKNTICGDFINDVMAKAVKMGESNACMRRIVAAPTAGSCGVVPAVLISLQEKYDFSDEKMVEAMYVVAGVGEIIATRAFISGAEGGCQAEIGSASAMAAAAASYLMGGDDECQLHASAIALKSLLGLVCDPVAGLVEVPCIKRNVIGAVNSLTSADLALAGIRSAIPPDEVIDAMRTVGMRMHSSLRETGEGGLAATKTGIQIANKVL
ncbi:L-serine ammonia-lyase, iron-sulfur-dependent, subunit alpha [Anaeromicropila herbilytica]|uniref:L-serine dehydratase n=1 Tax=Anaeromicropila herbilytica TaxID=2785025 RepID=A0A7R7IDX4_9FIRM|nr:L-serine ammonia-lyase, iron-sulfur-dependent, subunit alpha [Anaeromicropila herbilytica]BCN32163.1 L-serine dehydratase, iron-sulfur-dependent subunit alpha [Anaeromicropila herbilytica]